MKDKIVNAALWVLVLGLIFTVIGFITYARWTAYFERFPDASWWTFFVK